jgi:arabinogalactan endo-1,4-beta-galactosidase
MQSWVDKIIDYYFPETEVPELRNILLVHSKAVAEKARNICQKHPELKADDIISDCIKNIRYVSGKYGCDVMIVETGYEVDEAHPDVMEEGRRQLSRVIHEAQECTGGHCRGVFYWEPQCRPGGYKLCAFDSNGKPTAIMNGFIEK